MRRGLRLAGHPVHAMLSDFPMVLLLLWTVLEAAALVLESPLLWQVAHWALIGGVVAAGFAASAGLVDYLAIGSTKPGAARAAVAHMLVMVSVVVLAIIALVYRTSELPQHADRVLQVIALVLVAVGLACGGWLGGHLVFRYGIGVDDAR
jgi:uncharacterized membrane protein